MKGNQTIDTRNYANKEPVRMARELLEKGMKDNQKQLKEVKDGVELKTENTDVILEMVETIEKNKEPETLGKRKYSPNYMLNNYKTLIKNLDETGMLDEEDKIVLKHLGKKMVTRFISVDMFE